MTSQTKLALFLGCALSSGFVQAQTPAPAVAVETPAAAQSPDQTPPPPSVETPEAVAEQPLFVPPSTYDFSADPKLLGRIRNDAHGYFRFINVPFSQEVCRRFESFQHGVPQTNLHGDAHLEQYAVTEIGRGLTDFDDSSTGHITLDLVRFAVSIRLACRQNGWEDKAEGLIRECLRGYRAALNDPEIEAPEPSLVSRIQTGFKHLGPDYFKWVASLMEPIPDEKRKELEEAFEPYVEAMMAENPQFGREYFRLEKTGALRMGIGSALDQKYLLQIRGLTDDPLDDVVLEAKQVRDLRGISCVTSASNFDPFRILLGQARMSYTPFRMLGYVRFHDMNFWVHAWVSNYKELEVGTFENPEQLAEVVYDVGVQLGRGHPKQVADPFGWQLRRELMKLLDKLEPEILLQSKDLEEETVAAWKRFCAEGPQVPAP